MLYDFIHNGQLYQQWDADAIIEKFGATVGQGIVIKATKTLALNNVKTQYGTLLVQLMGNPTREERDTWERQRDWAVRYKSGDDTAEPLLLGLLTADERTALGETAATVMADKILAKNAAAEQLISLAGGIRRTAEKAVEAATDTDGIEAALTAAQTAATEAITQVQSQG